MKPVLLVLDDWEGQIAANPCWDEVKPLVDVQFLPVPIAEAPDSLLSEVRFLMALRERTTLTKDVFSRMPNLKLLLQTGGHAYHIDQSAAQGMGITIALGRHVKAPLYSVPELTMAMMLGLMHRVPQSLLAIRKGEWPLVLGRTLHKRRLGILGLGRHGTRVADIAQKAFGMEVVAWARAEHYTPSTDGIARVPLDELLRTSDVVSVHLRLSDASKGLLNEERLGMMKPRAILINTSRGAIVDEHALVNALATDKLAGAGLDVYTHEPLAMDSPLRSVKNIITTPHIGWTVEEVFDEFACIACTQLQQYMDGVLPEAEILV